MVFTGKIKIDHNGVSLYNKKKTYSRWEFLNEMNADDFELHEALDTLFKDIYYKFDDMEQKYNDLKKEYDELKDKYDYLQDYAYTNLCLIEDLDSNVKVLEKDVSDVVVKLED